MPPVVHRVRPQAPELKRYLYDWATLSYPDWLSAHSRLLIPVYRPAQ